MLTVLVEVQFLHTSVLQRWFLQHSYQVSMQTGFGHCLQVYLYNCRHKQTPCGLRS